MYASALVDECDSTIEVSHVFLYAMLLITTDQLRNPV
jgi:hypothetical protein